MSAIKTHPARLSILEALKVSSGGLRYTDMRPGDIENDLYNYHLQQLVKQGLVLKGQGKYILTAKGKEFLIELSPIEESGELNQFKLAAMCIVVREVGDGMEILYQYRTREPFLGELEIMAGGIKRGEPVIEAAKRRAFEEAGVTADFSLLGLLRKTRYDHLGRLYSDILFHVCVCRDYSGGNEQINEFGRKRWLSLGEAIAVEEGSANGSRHLASVLSGLSRKKLPVFYFEEVYNHDIY